tara:strand:+ start:1319 stop:1603 length:285 start_codon:yes stop_codon:yes gene_type:complete
VNKEGLIRAAIKLCRLTKFKILVPTEQERLFLEKKYPLAEGCILDSVSYKDFYKEIESAKSRNRGFIDINETYSGTCTKASVMDIKREGGTSCD